MRIRLHHALFCIEIGEHEHRMHAAQPSGGAGIDAADASVRLARAHEGDFQHARQRDVVDVAPAALEDRRVLDALHRGADVARPVHHASPRRRFAAARAAATMLA